MAKATGRELFEFFNPWVMRSALRKVETWYRQGEWNDPAEWLDWQAHPWERLAQLAEELGGGTYKPGAFPLVPFIKKGDYTRHYTMPSVKDQVAFMAYVILLGPFLEARMPNVSFGNRLFRPRVAANVANVTFQHTASNNSYTSTKRWVRAPFSLNEHRLYDRFEAGYGLFRRLIQWIANRAVLGHGDPELATMLEELELEDPELLPYYDFLRGASDYKGFPSDLAYARLDFSLAFPSVDRARLRNTIYDLLRDKSGKVSEGWGRPEFPSLTVTDRRTTGFRSWLEPERPFAGRHPWHVLAHGSEGEEFRLQLASDLMYHLDAVMYSPWKEPNGWEPHDIAAPNFYVRQGSDDSVSYDSHGIWPVTCHLPKDVLSSHRFGLPTGLAVSGILLNVALTPLDDYMCRRFDESVNNGQPPVFYLRFVDDIILLSPSVDELAKAVKDLAEVAKDLGNFRIGTDKAKPESVRAFLHRALNDEGGSADETLHYKADEFITRGKLELFTTAVVREMSGLADEGLDEADGTPGLDRLEELLDLAARNDDDWEVAADSRLTFAVGKIARASWPMHAVVEADRVVQPSVYVERILHIAETALRRHPWRIKLWRPLLIIALRACIADEQGDHSKLGRGKKWLLEHIVPLIRWGWGHAGKRLSECPLETWDPEATCPPKTDMQDVIEPVRQRRHQHRVLRASFHRASFWRAWAAVVRALQAIAEDLGCAQPEAWTAHFTALQARKLLSWFGDWKLWARCIYGQPHGEDEIHHPLWWWEVEALLDAILAVRPASVELLEALGNPRAQRLRQDVPPELLRLIADDDDLRGLYRALGAVLGYENMVVSPVRAPEDGREALLWCTRMKRSKADYAKLFAALDRQSATRVCPRSEADTLEWAALARANAFAGWRWDALATRMGSKLPKPLLPHDMSTDSDRGIWSRLICLDAYAQLRKILMAHDQVVPWGKFAGWFDNNELRTDVAPACDRRRTLLHAMYRFAGPEDTPESCVPAVEMPTPLAYAIFLELDKRHRQGWIAPDTIILTKESYDHIIQARAALTHIGNGRDTQDHERVYGPISQILDKKNSRIVRHVSNLQASCRAPHPLLLFPELVLREITPRQRASWRATIVFLWLISGGEQILDYLYDSAPWHLPISDRDSLRSRFMLPEIVWERLEKALGSLAAKREAMRVRLDQQANHNWQDGYSLKIRDIRFNLAGQWHVVPPDDNEACDDAVVSDEENLRSPTSLPTLNVRLVQIANQPAWSDWLKRFIRHSALPRRDEVSEVVAEIAERLSEAKSRALRQANPDQREHLLMLPEWSLPVSYVRKLEHFVRETGVAILAGLLPHERPTVVGRARPVCAEKQKHLRVLVNEAVLILPSAEQWQHERSTMRPPIRTFTFWIRKPYANAAELGLVMELARVSGAAWTFLPGLHWYRFTYPRWGSFTVSICSDILDTYVWDWMRGRIQHLFVTAWNQDVDLFDQFTWTRGYELYANVAMVNHGCKGGSVVWTPKHGPDKQVFHVHGSNHGLAVTVALPVRDLIDAQEHQLRHSVENEYRNWGEVLRGRLKESRSAFKTPAPNYQRKA